MTRWRARSGSRVENLLLKKKQESEPPAGAPRTGSRVDKLLLKKKQGVKKPQERSWQRTHGTTYGLIHLANGLGFALGPLAGGLIAATLGLRNVFFVTAAILLIIGAYLPFGVRDNRRRAET